MEKLIIDRSKWRTGGNPTTTNKTGLGFTLLLNDAGFMCCLGFESLRCGIPSDKLLNTGEPGEITPEAKLTIKIQHLVTIKYEYDEDTENYYINTNFTDIAMRLNDDYDLTSEEREERIKEHFATVDIEVEYIGEYTKDV